jgi:hypothetical protein
MPRKGFLTQHGAPPFGPPRVKARLRPPALSLWERIGGGGFRVLERPNRAGQIERIVADSLVALVDADQRARAPAIASLLDHGPAHEIGDAMQQRTDLGQKCVVAGVAPGIEQQIGVRRRVVDLIGEVRPVPPVGAAAIVGQLPIPGQTIHPKRVTAVLASAVGGAQQEATLGACFIGPVRLQEGASRKVRVPEQVR